MFLYSILSNYISLFNSEMLGKVQRVLLAVTNFFLQTVFLFKSTEKETPFFWFKTANCLNAASSAISCEIEGFGILASRRVDIGKGKERILGLKRAQQGMVLKISGSVLSIIS